MNLTYKSNQEAVLTLADGFDVLDVCHRQTVIALGKLAALVSQLSSKALTRRRGPWPARSFSTSRPLRDSITRTRSVTCFPS